MWIFLAILTLVLVINLLESRLESALPLAIFIIVLSFIKMMMSYIGLEKRYAALEKKFVQMQEHIETLGNSAPKPEEREVSTAYSKVNQIDQEEIVPAEVREKEVKEEEAPLLTPPPPSHQETFKLEAIQEPTFIDTIFDNIKSYFTTGNPMVKVGGVILFFGLSFLIKFAINNDMISIEIGLLCVLFFAITLITIGFRFKKRHDAFGLILQGIGIAIFYLAIFSAAKFFTILSFEVALAIMILTVFFATFMSLIQDAFYLAIFATVGGFLAPVLTATGEGSHVVLFSYYAILNLSIVAIAWFKSWRLLNLVGFLFTFVIATAWGVKSYEPEAFMSTEPFLIFFFLLYVVVAILFARKTSFHFKAYVDTALVFGVPSVGFGLQSSMVREMPYGLAYSALALGGLYISLAWWLRHKPRFSLLAESFLALGVLFLSLVFAFAFSPEVSAVIYALESSAIIWISLRQHRYYARIFALLLEFYAMSSFAQSVQHVPTPEYLFLNSIYLGFMIIAIATLLSAYVYEYYQKEASEYEAVLPNILLFIGAAIWLGAGLYELRDEAYIYDLLYMSLLGALFSLVALRIRWKSLSVGLELYYPLSTVAIMLTLYPVSHPFVGMNFLIFFIHFTLYYFMMARLTQKFSSFWHLLGFWLILTLFTWEIFYRLHHYSDVVALSVMILPSLVALYLIIEKSHLWPLRCAKTLYLHEGLYGVMFFILIWEFVAFTTSASVEYIPYIPLLNPLEMMQVSMVMAVAWWLRYIKVQPLTIQLFLVGTALIFVGLFWSRVVHYYFDVPYHFIDIKQSALFQTGISTIYTLIALGVIVFAKQIASRQIWIGGASLLALVIIKLLLTDMAQHNSLERIFSFMVVGLLTLVIGFVAPLPPKKEQK